MKAKLLFTIALVSVSLFAFSQEISSKITLNVGAGSNYYFTGSDSKLKSHYGIGGRVEMVVNDKFTFGYSQHASISKNGLLRTRTSEDERFSLFEHSASFGYKVPLATGLYFMPKANIGLGVLKVKQHYKSDWDEIKNEISEVAEGALFMAPEVKLGYELNKYLALETYVNYRRYFGSSFPAGIAAHDLNGLGTGLSIIGRIPLIK